MLNEELAGNFVDGEEDNADLFQVKGTPPFLFQQK
jgi:hypothetical protein